MIFRKVTVILLAVLIAPCLQAKSIFKCMDENNQASFSNKPCPDSSIDGDNESHKLWREMRGLVRRGLKINDLMGADVKAMNACQLRIEKYGKTLDRIKPRVEKLSTKHPDMVAAYLRLRDCAQCRASAMNACEDANGHLNDAMNDLMFML